MELGTTRRALPTAGRRRRLTDLVDLAARCIRCGFCLESCPTFVVTGKETESPRGRIYLARSAAEGKIAWEEARDSIDQCLGCRACETACPSGVQYGQILEMARDRLESDSPHISKRALLAGMTRPSALAVQLRIARLLRLDRMPEGLSLLLAGARAETDLPRAQAPADLPPFDPPSQPELRGEVYLLEGCAMRVLYPRVHQATRRLLRRVGYAVREVPQGCCGSLFAHNGCLDEACDLAADLIAAMPDELPVVVNSAGCGSAMRGYRELLGSPAASAFSARTVDASVFLHSAGLGDLLQAGPGYSASLTYHDACHLAHGQRVTLEPRELLRAIPRIEFVELPEADMCCGSAGIYNLLQPTMARNLVERKMDNVERTGAAIVATGNPGCHAWIAQAARERGRDVRVLHTMEALEAAFTGLDAFSDDGTERTRVGNEVRG